MTALSTTSPGIKPPTTRLADTIGQHVGELDRASYASGGLVLYSAGTGVAVRELDVTGSGYLQFLLAGNKSGSNTDITLELAIDGTTLYSYTQVNAATWGPCAAGGLFYFSGTGGYSLSLEALRFEQGFTVDMTATSTNSGLVYKYYLD
jgi:hypothetical protein